VVGQAKSGEEAVKRVVELEPDVVTMDFNMPGWSGAKAVREIMKARPTPVVMFSAHTREGAKETLEALAAGAVDFVAKPAGEVSTDLSSVEEELSRKLIAAASSRPRAPRSVPRPARQVVDAPLPAAPASARAPSSSGPLPRLCVVAVSTGGPVALSRVLPLLPADLAMALVVVQHMPAHFLSALAERLHAECRIEVREAKAGDRPRPGLALIAPGDKHLEFDDRGAIVLVDGPLVHGCRPAADITMLSAARVYGRRAVGVVMTGMGKDGTAGALAIRRAEGRTLAQDEATSVIFGMPKSAIEAGAIETIVPLDELAERITALA
jgi:two-component system chemotaxis response regulator CheB